MSYISGLSESEDAGCIFCRKSGEEDDEGNLIVHRSDSCFVLMNLYPYNNSHLMVVPYRHCGNFEELEADELLDCQRAIQRALRVMRETIRPQGWNLGMNLGRAGGAGIDTHLHWHVVPRWVGDTNFMPVLGQTKVISESIEESRRRMAEGFQGL